MTDFSYQITEDEENNLVHLVVHGSLKKKDGEKVIVETRSLASQLGCGILCDIRNASFDVNMADWYYLVRDREVYPTIPKDKTAILINKESWKLFKFVENVTRNVGMRIRIFRNKQDALDWLKLVE